MQSTGIVKDDLKKKPLARNVAFLVCVDIREIPTLTRVPRGVRLSRSVAVWGMQPWA